MFIEKLTKNDITKLVNQIKNSDLTTISSISKSKEAIFVKTENLTIGSYWIRIEDFKISILHFINEYTTDKNKNDFKTFMYNKFGKKYKDAFNENLKKEYESKLESELIK